HSRRFKHSASVRPDSRRQFLCDRRRRGLDWKAGHLIVIDDPIRDAAEARSETVRRGILDWYRQVVLTRQQPGAAVVLIQTRWHLDDLTGFLLREQTNNEWRLLSFPAFDGEGRALWPER